MLRKLILNIVGIPVSVQLRAVCFFFIHMQCHIFKFNTEINWISVVKLPITGNGESASFLAKNVSFVFVH